MDTGSNTQKLQSAWQGLSQDKRADGRGSVYVFTSPKSKIGTSFVTRCMALIAASTLPKDKQVLIVDMDIQANAQASWFFAQQALAQYGSPEGPYDACFGTSPFWRVTPSMVDDTGQSLTDNHFMSLYMVNAANVAFTCFQWEKLRQGQTAHIQNARDYWHNLRKHFGAIFVDTPALDRSDIISTVCPEADATILVSTAQDVQSKSLGDTHEKIEAMAGHCSGVVLNELPNYYASHEGSL